VIVPNDAMRTRPQNRRPIFSAGLCLLAVALFYAPFAAAAWSARTMDCCAGDHCPVSEHHHRKSPAGPDAAVDCGHEMSGLTACTVACCHPSDRPLVVPFAFVLPAFASVPTPAAARPNAQLKQLDLPGFSQPLFPPPRIAVTAL
jgi:hypothetical protein